MPDRNGICFQLRACELGTADRKYAGRTEQSPELRARTAAALTTRPFALFGIGGLVDQWCPTACPASQKNGQPYSSHTYLIPTAVRNQRRGRVPYNTCAPRSVRSFRSF